MKVSFKKRIGCLAMVGILGASTLLGGCSKGGSDDTIYLGGTFTLTGNLSASGTFCKQGLELFNEDVKDMDVLGKKVEVIVEDAGSDQQTVINATNKMIARENISAVFGVGNTSADALAVSDVVKDSKIPHFVFGSSAKLHAANPYFMLGRMADNFSGVLFASAAVESLGMKKIAIINVSDAFGTSLRDEVIKNLKTYGVEPVFTASYNADEKNFVPLLTKVKDSGADGLIAIGQNFDAALVAKAAQSMNLDIPKLGSASYCSVISAEAAGDAINGWYSIGDWSPNPINEEGKAFVKRFVEKFNTKPDKAAVITYDAYMLMCEAIKLSGDSTPEGVIEGLKQIKDYKGVMGTYSWHDDQSLINSQPLVIMEKGEAQVVEMVDR